MFYFLAILSKIIIEVRLCQTDIWLLCRYETVSVPFYQWPRILRDNCHYIPKASLKLRPPHNTVTQKQIFYKSSQLLRRDLDITLKTPKTSQIAKFMAPTWDPPGSCRAQMGPMLAPWTLLSGSPISRPWGCVWWVYRVYRIALFYILIFRWVKLVPQRYWKSSLL